MSDRAPDSSASGTVTPDGFARLRRLFEEALERPQQERRAFLDAACAGQPDVREAVERMVAADAVRTPLLDVSRASVAGEGYRRTGPWRCPSCREAFAPDDRFCRLCGTPTTGSDAADGRFRPGALFANRFRIVARLGHGGMGEVYRADDLELGQPVALKFLTSLRSDERARQRLRNEVRLARQLAHPNVCRVYDIGEANGELYLSMEYVDGEDLAALLKRIGRIPVDKGIEIARKLSAGLAAAHAKGVLHRDFKPANIMVDASGEVRIMDFGLAAVATELDARDIRSGTPAYMAPEQLAGREATVQSDLYALGLVLFELFTGKTPFNAREPQELQRQRESRPSTAPATLIPDLGGRIERTILRCLEPDATLRPSSALEVSASLPGGDPLADALAAGETPSPEMVAAAGSTETMAPRLALALAAIVAAGLIGVLWLTPRMHVLTHVPLTPPEELNVRARDIASSLGYGEGIADSEAWLQYDRRYPVYVGGRLTPDRSVLFDALARTPSPITFSYEAGPTPFIRAFGGALGGRRMSYATAAQATGLVAIDLDPTGRLRRVVANPTRRVGDGAGPNPDWAALFRSAGLDLTRFTPAEANGGDVQADTTVAWTGVSSTPRPVPVRVEAASLRGQVTRFEVRFPWSTSRGLSSPPSPVGYFHDLFSFTRLLFLFTMPLLAWFNCKRGRADVPSAVRLAIFFSTPVMLTRLTWGISGIPYSTVSVTFMSYLALEPLARRRWPHAMVTWARVLAGRVRDPLVGRDLLIAVAAVLSDFFVQRAIGYYAGWYLDPGASATDPADYGFDLDSLFGGRILATRIGVALGTGLPIGFIVFSLLFAGRTVLRRLWLLPVVLLALWGPIGGIDSAISGDWASLFEWTTQLGVAVFLIARLGLFAACVASALTTLIDICLLTSDFNSWYGQSSLVVTLVLVAVAAYGFYAALGGRPLAALTGDAPPVVST